MANLLIYILSVLDFVIEFFVKQISKNKRLYTLVIRFQFIVNISSSLSTFHRDETIYCIYYFWHIIQELGVLSLLFLRYTLGSTASFVSWSNKLFSIEDSKAGLTLICLSDRKIYGSNGIQTHIHLVRKWTLNQYTISCYDIIWRKNNFASLNKNNLPITSRISMKNV